MREGVLFRVGEVIVRMDDVEHRGLHGEAGEGVVGVARVLVSAAEIVVGGDRAHAGDGADAVFEGQRHGLSEGNAIADDQPQGLIGRGLMQKEHAVHGHQDPEHAERRGDAQDGENAAAAITHRVPEDERKEGHNLLSYGAVGGNVP